YIPLPVGYGDVTAEANRSFLTSTYFTTPKLHGGFKSDDKGFYILTLGLGHDFDTDIYYEGHYWKTDDSTWTDIGDFKGTSSDRYPVIYIPADSSSNNPVDKWIQFKFVAKTDDTQKAPVLLSYDCRAVLYPTARKIIACKVRCGKKVLSKIEGQPTASYEDTKDALDNLRTATWPITIKDLDGTSQTVKYLTLPGNTPIREPVLYEKGEVIEWVYNLLLLVVPLA
ncbi:hypothetical protein LCGC14_2500560, partial [marine sediment metagenome]